MTGNEIEAGYGGQNQPQVQSNMTQPAVSKNVSPRRPEECNAQPQSAQSSSKQGGAAQLQPQQNIGQNYSQPVLNNLRSITGVIQTNGQQQQQQQQQQQKQQQQPLQQAQMQTPIQRVSSLGNTQQTSPKDNNLQYTQPVQQNLNPNLGQLPVQMHVLQQVPQQTLFQQHQHQPPQQQRHQMGQQQQNIINQQLLAQQAFSLQQQPIMFQHQMIPQQQFQQQRQPQQHQQQRGMQQQMYQPQLQQHVAMVQTPVLYAAQPTAVVSNPVPAPSSTNNTPDTKTVKKGRFRVVKPGKQDPTEVGDGQSVVSSTSDNPNEIVAPAVTTKKKGRFLVKTTSVSETGKLSPTKESVADANRSDVDDTVSKGIGLPPQMPPSSDKAVVGTNNVKKKGRFRVKSGLNLTDTEASVASDKAHSHVRLPSDDTLQSIPKISSVGEVSADENAHPIASNKQVPAPTANTQVPHGMEGGGGSNNSLPQYTTFVPSMTSYDVNNKVMMVSAPFLTAQNTTMPMMQTSVQQSQMQQMYQNQVQIQQQQQHHQQQRQLLPQQQIPVTQQVEHNVVPSSHPPGLPLSNPNSPNPRTEPTQTQPQVPLLPQQARSGSPIPKRPTASSAQTGTYSLSGGGGWRGISGSHGKNGRLIGCGGVGKILHNLDSLRQEILDADKSITSLQSDNRLLRNKNKELDTKIMNLEKRLAEEKSLRRSADVKLQSLRQKVKELESPRISDTQAGEETCEKMNEIAPIVASDGKQVPKKIEEKSPAATITPTTVVAPATTVAKPQETDDCDNGQDSKSQTSPPKKSVSLNKVEGEPKPPSPLSIRRNHTGSMSDLDTKQFDPLVAVAPPPLCPPTSSVIMAQSFQSLVDDNIAPIPMIVTTQEMSTPDVATTIEPKGTTESGQHFDPLGTPEKSQSQLNIQTLVLDPMVPSVPLLTHLNGSPAMATVPVYTLPIPTIQLPPQQQQQQQQLKQAEHDPFDEIVCRGQHGEQNGNGYHDCMR